MVPDNPGPITPGSPVAFPRDGPIGGTSIARTGPSSFNLAYPGTYFINFHVSVNESAQLAISMNNGLGPIFLSQTVVRRTDQNSELVGLFTIDVPPPVSGSFVEITLHNPLVFNSSFTLSSHIISISAHLNISKYDEC